MMEKTPEEPVENEIHPAPKELSIDDLIDFQKDCIKDTAAFTNRVHGFLELLQVHLTPERHATEYEFVDSEGSAETHPEILQQRLADRTLSHIGLSIVQEGGTYTASSIEAHDEDGRLYISRRLGLIESDDQDVMLEEAEMDAYDGYREWTPRPLPTTDEYVFGTPAGRIPIDELARFQNNLAGIDSQIIDLDTVDPVGVFYPPNHIPQFEAQSLNTISWFSFEAKSGTTVNFSVQHTSDDEILDTQLIYKTGSGEKIIATIDHQDGFAMSFHVVRRGLKHLIEPDAGDYMRFLELIEQEEEQLLRAYAPNDVEEFDENEHSLTGYPTGTVEIVKPEQP
jgi:hypothetical protein